MVTLELPITLRWPTDLMVLPPGNAHPQIELQHCEMVTDPGSGEVRTDLRLAITGELVMPLPFPPGVAVLLTGSVPVTFVRGGAAPGVSSQALRPTLRFQPGWWRKAQQRDGRWIAAVDDAGAPVAWTVALADPIDVTAAGGRLTATPAPAFTLAPVLIGDSGVVIAAERAALQLDDAGAAVLTMTAAEVHLPPELGLPAGPLRAEQVAIDHDGQVSLTARIAVDAALGPFVLESITVELAASVLARVALAGTLSLPGLDQPLAISLDREDRPGVTVYSGAAAVPAGSWSLPQFSAWDVRLEGGDTMPVRLERNEAAGTWLVELGLPALVLRAGAMVQAARLDPASGRMEPDPDHGPVEVRLTGVRVRLGGDQPLAFAAAADGVEVVIDPDAILVGLPTGFGLQLGPGVGIDGVVLSIPSATLHLDTATSGVLLTAIALRDLRWDLADGTLSASAELDLDGASATAPLFDAPWLRDATVAVEIVASSLRRVEIQATVDVALALDHGAGAAPLRVRLTLTLGPDGRARWTLTVLEGPSPGHALAELTFGESDQVFAAGLAILPPLVAAAEALPDPVADVAAAAAAQFVGEHVLRVSRLTVDGLRLADDPALPAGCVAVDIDYSVDVAVTVASGDAPWTRDPVRIAWRGFGLRWNPSPAPGELPVSFRYQPGHGTRIALADQGRLALPGALGKLITVTGLTLGVDTSVWLEAELELAADLVLLTVDRLRARVSYSWSNDALTFALSPAAVGITIPGVLSGRGALTRRGASVGGELALELVPLGIHLTGALELKRSTITSLYASTELTLPIGIPIGGAAAIYGLALVVAINADRTQGSASDLAWYTGGPTVGVTDLDKWEPAGRGHWAIGLGLVLGTSLDSGFLIHTTGLALVQAPGPRLLLAQTLDAMAEVPGLGDDPPGLVATIALDFGARTLTAGVHLHLPLAPVIDLSGSVETFLDLTDPTRFHLYLGQYQPSDRRLRAKVFGLLDAWAYLMIDGHGIDLGDNRLGGPAVALGAGCDLFWGDREINLYLAAWAEVHAGLGVNPVRFVGMLAGGGALGLIVVTLSVFAELTVEIPGDPVYLHGEVCGSIDLFFFEISACFGFTLGKRVDPPLPDVSTIVGSLVLHDRRTTKTYAGSADARAPIDAIPVLGFLRPMNAGDVGDHEVRGSFSFTNRPGGAADTFWVVESGRTRVAFMVTSLTLTRIDGGRDLAISDAVAAWGDPQGRGSISMMTWNGDPTWRHRSLTAHELELATDAIGEICDETSEPELACLTFADSLLGDVVDELVVTGAWTLRVVGHGNTARPGGMIGAVRFGGAAPRVVAAGPASRWLRLPAKGSAGFGSDTLVLHTDPLDRCRLVIAMGSKPLTDPEVKVTLFGDGPKVTLTSFHEDTDAQPTRRTYEWSADAGRPTAIDRIEITARTGLIDTPVETRANTYLSLVEVCGRPRAWTRTWQAGGKAADAVRATWDVLSGGELLSTSMLLEGSAQYSLTVSGLTRREGTDTVDDWKQERKFWTATTSPDDISERIEDTFPPAGFLSHYRRGEISIAFVDNTIDALFEVYDEQLVLLLEADDGSHIPPDLGETATRDETPATAYEREYRTKLGLSCIGDAAALWRIIKKTYRATLAPDTGYRAALHGVKRGPVPNRDALTDAPVFAWRFRSSRYLSLAEHLADFAARAELPVIGGAQAEQAVGHRSTAEEVAARSTRSGRTLEDVLYRDLGAPVLPAATRNRCFQIVDDRGRSLGVLVDSVEPLFKPGLVTLTVRDRGGRSVQHHLFVNERGTRALIWSPGTALADVTARLRFTPPSGNAESGDLPLGTAEQVP